MPAAIVKLDTYRNLLWHRAVLPGIARLSCYGYAMSNTLYSSTQLTTYRILVAASVETTSTKCRRVPRVSAARRQSASSWKTRWNRPLVSWRMSWQPLQRQHLSPICTDLAGLSR